MYSMRKLQPHAVILMIKLFGRFQFLVEVAVAPLRMFMFQALTLVIAIAGNHMWRNDHFEKKENKKSRNN